VEADWRLALPTGLVRGYVLSSCAFRAAHARPLQGQLRGAFALTGPHGDSYTNILTVKLFARAER
jgi:hypothetical protein